MEEPGGQTVTQCPCTPTRLWAAVGGGGQARSSCVRLLDVRICVTEQMLLLTLTDLYRCPVCGVGKCTWSPEFHPGPSFHDKQ